MKNEGGNPLSIPPARTAGARNTSPSSAQGQIADSVLIIPIQDLLISATSAPVLARNAAGDWSWNRTAGGAETLNFAVVLNRARLTANKGPKITSVTVAYQIGVVDATSVDLTAAGTVYAQATAPAVTASFLGVVADGQYDGNHNTAAKRKDHTVASGEHLLVWTPPTPIFVNSSATLTVVEFTAVLANTGTLKVRHIALGVTEAA